MRITERRQRDVTILDLQGKMTLDDGVVEFRDTIHRLLDEGKNQILLKWGLIYIDHAGLQELIKSWRPVKEHGGMMKILNFTKLIGPGLLVVTPIFQVFEVFDDEQTALASFRPDQS